MNIITTVKIPMIHLSISLKYGKYWFIMYPPFNLSELYWILLLTKLDILHIKLEINK